MKILLQNEQNSIEILPVIVNPSHFITVILNGLLAKIDKIEPIWYWTNNEIKMLSHQLLFTFVTNLKIHFILSFVLKNRLLEKYTVFINRANNYYIPIDNELPLKETNIGKSTIKKRQ
jgi:hypothetical protein